MPRLLVSTVVQRAVLEAKEVLGRDGRVGRSREFVRSQRESECEHMKNRKDAYKRSAVAIQCQGYCNFVQTMRVWVAHVKLHALSH